MPTIVSQIELAEQDLQLCESSLDKVDRKIRISNLTDTQLQTLQNEIKDLNKEKKKQECSCDDIDIQNEFFWGNTPTHIARPSYAPDETTLKRLRKENGKTTFLSFVILALVVIVYYAFWAS